MHFIRPGKENGTISILNEDFDVDKSLTHEYVCATINTQDEQFGGLLSGEECGSGGHCQGS